MKHRSPNDYGVLDSSGLVAGKRTDYWITEAGHAHTQPASGAEVNAKGKRHEGGDFRPIEMQA